MQVLLKTDVPNLGQSGDIKNVKNGYARNYLIPRGFVIVADARTKKEGAFLKQMQERKVAKRKREAEQKVEELKDLSVEIKAKIGKEGKLYGSVTNIDIHKELSKQKIEIERRMIQLENPIKTLGIFKVPVRLHEGVHIEVSVKVTDEEGNTSIEEALKASDEKTNANAEEAAPASDEEAGTSVEEAAPTPDEQANTSAEETSQKPPQAD